MRIQSILDGKGSRVEAVDADVRVEDAARTLADHGIGSLVVRDGATIVGILDERDIVYGLAKHGRAVFDLAVSVVMRREPVTCTPDQNVREVMALVTARRVRHVLVIGPLGPCGVVSIGDVVKHRLEEAQLEVSVLRDYARAKIDPTELATMVKLVFCCRRRPELSLEQFQKRWLELHGPLVRRLREQIPQMKRYVQSHTIPGEPSEMLRASRGAKPPYDGITEVWFDSLASLGASGEAGLAAARRLYEDEAEFIDFANSAVFLTEEHEIF